MNLREGITLQIKRLDHHGIVAGVINDLNLVELIDESIHQDEQQEITTGEAVKGMIMNGLGFSNRPLSLTPQFFTNLPMEHLFRKGVQASHFNRHKLGRTLDQCHTFGCESLFALLSHQACEKEGVNTQFHSLDTTSFSLSGQYQQAQDDNGDEHPVQITHGYSKDHRSDLKQVVQEMIVSQDSGIPLACKTWNGNASDNQIFKERTQALISTFNNSSMPNYLVADSKLYHRDNARFLSQLTFITRIPSTNKQEQTQVSQALSAKQWITIDDNYRYTPYTIKHMGIEQRWLVVFSQAAQERAEKTVMKQVKKLKAQYDKALFHLQAQRFACEADAFQALSQFQKTLKYHQVTTSQCMAHHQYEGKGRPTKETPIKYTKWQILADIESDTSLITQAIEKKACFVLGTNASDDSLNDKAILYRYKEQSTVERGFRFLKDPLFFVSSLFIKKPSRIQALLMIMLLALLIYSIAERRIRRAMKKNNATIPNQINKPTSTPTLRWIFQCFEGINTVQSNKLYDYHALLVDGMDELRQRIVSYLGYRVAYLYKNQNFTVVG